MMDRIQYEDGQFVLHERDKLYSVSRWPDRTGLGPGCLDALGEVRYLFERFRMAPKVIPNGAEVARAIDGFVAAGDAYFESCKSLELSVLWMLNRSFVEEAPPELQTMAEVLRWARPVFHGLRGHIHDAIRLESWIQFAIGPCPPNDVLAEWYVVKRHLQEVADMKRGGEDAEFGTEVSGDEASATNREGATDAPCNSAIQCGPFMIKLGKKLAAFYACVEAKPETSIRKIRDAVWPDHPIDARLRSRISSTLNNLKNKLPQDHPVKYSLHGDRVVREQVNE